MIRFINVSTRVQQLLLVVILAACQFMFSACSQQDEGAQQLAEPTKVSLRLQWFPLAQFAGFYVAQQKGFYAKHGIDITINPGGPDFNAITLVANGSDTFGIWTADQILVAMNRGVPIKVVAAIYRKDPNVLMVKHGSGIHTPKDFQGKTVTTVFGRATETVLQAMLKKEAVPTESVNIVPFPFNLQSFAKGQVDVSAAYVYDHPFQARKLGLDVDLIDPADYGINFYSDCLFVRADLVESNPKLVEQFVHATLEGWEYALAHQDEAVAIVLKETQGLDRESQAYMLKHSEPLIRHENAEQLGLVSKKSLEDMVAILRDQKLLDKAFDVEQVFTNRFVDSYYRK